MKGFEKRHIGENIGSIRQYKGLSQAQLARMIGVSSTTINRYELAQMKPKNEHLLKLENALELNSGDLYNNYMCDCYYYLIDAKNQEKTFLYEVIGLQKQLTKKKLSDEERKDIEISIKEFNLMLDETRTHIEDLNKRIEDDSYKPVSNYELETIINTLNGWKCLFYRGELSIYKDDEVLLLNAYKEEDCYYLNELTEELLSIIEFTLNGSIGRETERRKKKR